MENIHVRALLPADYEAVLAFWRQTPGICLSEADSQEAIAVFLERNPGLSFIAEADRCLLGTLLCGHDGRRGFLYHLAVHPEHRRKGIGKQLVKHGLDGLKQAGINKCHLFVLADNGQGLAFWNSLGFPARKDICICSHNIGCSC